MQVYSLDWDKQYLEDEAVLQAAGGYNSNDYQFMEALLPGQPLWPNLPPPPVVVDTSAPQPAPPEGETELPAPSSKLLLKQHLCTVLGTIMMQQVDLFDRVAYMRRILTSELGV